MWTLFDIHNFIIRDCLFNCPYELCTNDICNLCYHVSLNMIEQGIY